MEYGTTTSYGAMTTLDPSSGDQPCAVTERAECRHHLPLPGALGRDERCGCDFCRYYLYYYEYYDEPGFRLQLGLDGKSEPTG